MSFNGDIVHLSLAHGVQIEDIRHRFHHDTSSHSFPLLYIWRRFVGSELFLQPDMFTLRYLAKGENTWLFPCGDREAAKKFILEHLGESGFSLCYLLPQDAVWLESEFPQMFRIVPSPGDSEYLVRRAAHMKLEGKKYEKLRNKVNRAVRDYQIQTECLGPENIAEALAVIREWRGERTAGGSLKMYGDEEDVEPLLNMETLGITGILMRMDGKPYGVAAGFMLSEDTYDLFLAKETGRDPVLGYVLRREWMRSLPDSVTWVNLEDDLDIEGLRTMKKQMIPERMNEMQTAVRRSYPDEKTETV